MSEQRPLSVEEKSCRNMIRRDRISWAQVCVCDSFSLGYGTAVSVISALNIVQLVLWLDLEFHTDYNMQFVITFLCRKKNLKVLHQPLKSHTLVSDVSSTNKCTFNHKEEGEEKK